MKESIINSGSPLVIFLRREKISQRVARQGSEKYSDSRLRTTFTQNHRSTVIASRERVACINKSAVRAAGGGIACNPGARRIVCEKQALFLLPLGKLTPRRINLDHRVYVPGRVKEWSRGLNCTARFYFRRVLVPRFGFSLSPALPSLRPYTYTPTLTHILYSLSLSLRICYEFLG